MSDIWGRLVDSPLREAQTQAPEAVPASHLKSKFPSTGAPEVKAADTLPSTGFLTFYHLASQEVLSMGCRSIFCFSSLDLEMTYFLVFLPLSFLG